jgi:hypothetical protein
MAMRSLAEHLQHRLATRAEDLSHTWLDAIVDRLPEAPRRVFPTRTLLNQMPEVLRRLVRVLDGGPSPATDTFVLQEVERLTELRRRQGYSLAELFSEFEALRHVLVDAFQVEMEAYAGSKDVVEAIDLSRRLFTGIDDLFTIASRCYAELRSDDRSQRAHLLERFANVIDHEMRNRTNFVALEVQLALEHLDAGEIDGAREVLRHAAAALQTVDPDGLGTLVASVLREDEGDDDPRTRGLGTVVGRAVADLDDYARHHGVELELGAEMPDFQVESGRLRLALFCLLAGIIRFSDGAGISRKVTIRGELREAMGRIEIRHDGSGISSTIRDDILGAAQVSSATQESPGFALIVARDAIEQLGGRLLHRLTEDGEPLYAVEIPAPEPELAISARE